MLNNMKQNKKGGSDIFTAANRQTEADNGLSDFKHFGKGDHKNDK